MCVCSSFCGLRLLLCFWLKLSAELHFCTPVNFDVQNLHIHTVTAFISKQCQGRMFDCNMSGVFHRP